MVEIRICDRCGKELPNKAKSRFLFFDFTPIKYDWKGVIISCSNFKMEMCSSCFKEIVEILKRKEGD